jgi:hypothetical protein
MNLAAYPALEYDMTFNLDQTTMNPWLLFMGISLCLSDLAKAARIGKKTVPHCQRVLECVALDSLKSVTPAIRLRHRCIILHENCLCTK